MQPPHISSDLVIFLVQNCDPFNETFSLNMINIINSLNTIFISYKIAFCPQT
jgi:hypothetical protein